MRKKSYFCILKIVELMKRMILFAAAVLLSTTMMAQAYQDRFDAALSAGNIQQQRQVLAEWVVDAPEDIDCYIARYNYFVNYIGEEASRLADEAQFATLAPIADSAFAVIDEAIGRYPNRLDLRFGKIYFLGVLRQWDAFADEILATLNHSEGIEHLWSFPNMDGGMVDVVTESMLDYQSTMFDAVDNWDQPTAGDTAMMLRIRKVAKRTVQLFPRDIASVNILATTYTFFKEYESAIKYLQRAERIDPNDPVVLKNMRDVYDLMGKKKQAKQYQDRMKNLE